MKDLETLHWELVHAVAIDMFFYIVADNTAVVSYLFDVPMESYLNKVIYFKEGLEIAIVDEKETFQKVINKKNHLESNLLKLTSIREELKEENFKIVLDRHMQWVEMSCIHSTFLFQEIHNLKTDKTAYYKRIFELQNKNLKSNGKELLITSISQKPTSIDLFNLPIFAEP